MKRPTNEYTRRFWCPWMALGVVAIMSPLQRLTTAMAYPLVGWHRATILHPSHEKLPETPCEPLDDRQRLLLNRRDWMVKTLWQCGISSMAFATPSLLTNGGAMAAPTTTNKDDLIASIRQGTKTLQTLLDNWAKAVIDCTYADVPRDLLESKNKELLLEKASTNALFDKSASVVSCKTTNRIVRDYLGATGKGPLVGFDKKLQQSVPIVSDADDVTVDLEAYVQLIEEVQQALSKANSLSYTAGVSDLSSINNFDKENEETILASNNNLQEARAAIQTAVKGLDRILTILDPSTK